METIIGIAAGILTSVSMVPQLIKVLKEKEVENLSPLMVGILLTGVSMWVVYGVMLGDLPIIVSNAFSVFVNATLLMCYFLFRPNTYIIEGTANMDTICYSVVYAVILAGCETRLAAECQSVVINAINLLQKQPTLLRGVKTAGKGE